MFRVKSSFKAKLEIKAPLNQVREFFADLHHFTDLLGGVESIRREPGGVMRWTIATETPVGLVRMSLPVRQTSPRASVIEWSPALQETQKLMRQSIKIEEGKGAPLLNVSEQVALRRNRAWETFTSVAPFPSSILNE